MPKRGMAFRGEDAMVSYEVEKPHRATFSGPGNEEYVVVQAICRPDGIEFPHVTDYEYQDMAARLLAFVQEERFDLESDKFSD